MTRDAEGLIAYIEDREDWSFGYGPEPMTHDCARAADGAVFATHGVRPLAAFSSVWTTERGARRVLARHGGMATAVSEVMSPIDPTLAGRGDVGLTADDRLVVFEGQTVVSPGARGWVREPRRVAVKAWTVA